MGGGQDQDDPEGAGGVNSNGNIGDNGHLCVASKTFPVTASRAPVHELLMSELENALREEVDRVKASFLAVVILVVFERKQKNQRRDFSTLIIRAGALSVEISRCSMQ